MSSASNTPARATPPEVSVVIPLYGAERTIAGTLASVLAQSWTDFEVIVVDDGSTDRGPDIVWGLADHRVRIVTQENRGLAGARNTGIREARGAYVALLDADDRWHQHKLTVHVAALAARPEVGLSFDSSRLVDDDGHPLGLVQHPSRATVTPADVLCRNPVGNGSAAVLRRAALDDLAFHDPRSGRVCWFDESFRQSEDVECWTRLVATTRWHLAHVPATLTDYRVNSAGLSAHTARQLDSWRRFRAKVATYAPDLERTHGDLAEAYQLRYLARRAVRSGDGPAAVGLMAEALRLAPAIVREEPSRTTITLAAALARCVLPRAAYARLETAAMGFVHAAASPRLPSERGA
jgi:hypothetical protein